MSRSQKWRQEWSFFIGDSGRRKYNRFCVRCVHSCKQSFRADLIACPRGQLRLSDPVFPATGENFVRWICDAVYDPRARELRVVWAEGIDGPTTPWRLSYCERRLASGEAPPSGELDVPSVVEIRSVA